MKKHLILILTLMLCLPLAACGGSGTEEGSGEDGDRYAVEDMKAGTAIGDFVSEDLDGNEVNRSVFGDKDLTVLNVWATFCNPCIAEMPDLAAWSDELPGNVQIVGVVIDAPPAAGSGDKVWGGDAGNIELAKDICSETGVSYTNILASDSVMEAFADVEAVPTTFILDKEGKLVCRPIVGADVDAYKKAVEEYLAK